LSTNQNIIPVILSGGTGTRLWPVSRQSFPKQYQKLIDKNKGSLLQETYKRLRGLEGLTNPILVCNDEHRFIAAEQMREIGVKPNSIFLEPCGRNTCPAITIAAMKAIEHDKNSLILVLAADHHITDQKKFRTAILKGRKYANSGRLITFGIKPVSPETGYGYIEVEKISDQNRAEALNIIRFIEKPKLEKAKEFIKDDKYLWNSGMFLFKASLILEEIKKQSPMIFNACENSYRKKTPDLDFQRLDNISFRKCPDLSIDIAIMEKTTLGSVIPLDSGWSDVGSWSSVWEIKEKDRNENVKEGNIIMIDSKKSFFSSQGKLVVGLGIKNLLVIETNDAILIADKKKSQDVKEIVTLLEKKGLSQAKVHQKIYRPWGYYISIEEDSRWQIKKIVVNPGASLSLQMHHHRSEHWIVVKGTAQVELGNEIKILSENESTYIPLGERHRLINPGKIPLTLIEVQSGSYIGEDDIVRLSDNYGRINNQNS
tara:strand:+ start:1076 stop:2530 length:1455 start_codon:yes stop_codon:yes gene_type:complete